MPQRRELEAFTDKQLAAVEQGQLSGRERKLIATIRVAETAANTAREHNYGGRVDELSREVERLTGQLERLNQASDHYRVLIVATKDESIEVFADPHVRVKVACLPETRTKEGYERSVEWALGKLPDEFKHIVNDCDIRPELFSVRCMSRAEWALYRDRMEAIGYLEQIGAAVEEITTQKQEHEASEAGTGPPPTAERFPF